tara:strand:+ start:54 stop:605 length:552 start_codon:yes stop_codon:yes gene_type:complete
MATWIRIDYSGAIQEVIDYDPNGVINEGFLNLFKGPFGDDVKLGYEYDASNNTCTKPTGYALNPQQDRYVEVPEGATVNSDGVIVMPPPSDPPEPEEEPTPEPEPTYINEAQFRDQLTLAEKLVWDNPSEGTSAQRSAINTVLRDFPHLVDGTEFQEELDLLESTEVIGTGRAATLLTYFSSL